MMEVTNQSSQTSVKVPDNAELIDEAFYVWETRFGLFTSMTVEGRKMLTGGTKEGVIEMTAWHLKCEIDGTLDDYSRVINSGVVGGKL